MYIKNLEKAKIMFDLNGFIRIPAVLSKNEVILANQAIDAHASQFKERTGTVLRNTFDDTPLSGDRSTGRRDLGGALGWDTPYSNVFRDMLCHKNLVPFLHLLIGDGYRLDHSPLVIAQGSGSEGFSLHGGPSLPSLQYICQNGKIQNTLLGVSFQLNDHRKGDGGFCVVRGSHKMNFALTEDIKNGKDQDFWQSCVEQLETVAGDVVIFSEATVHGCMPWKNKERERRIVLFRFSSPVFAHARGYSSGWPESYTRGMTAEQLCVMQPPYHPAYDRTCLNEDGSACRTTRRSEKKRAFDKEVFGESYY